MYDIFLSIMIESLMEYIIVIDIILKLYVLVYTDVIVIHSFRLAQDINNKTKSTSGILRLKTKFG